MRMQIFSMLVLGSMFSCDDDDKKPLAPDAYAWINTRQSQEIVHDNFDNSGNWQYENAVLAEGQLTLNSTAANRAAAYNTLAMDYSKDWQLETTLIPGNANGSVRLHWESDLFNEHFYEVELDFAEDNLVIQRTGTSAIFGPPTTPQSTEIENGDPVLVTTRKVDGKIYVFIDTRLVLTRDYEPGYGHAITFYASGGAIVRLDELHAVYINR